jgi:hypothetical protein
MVFTGLGLAVGVVWLVTTYYLLIGPTWWYCVFRMMFTGRRGSRGPQLRQWALPIAPDTGGSLARGRLEVVLGCGHLRGESWLLKQCPPPAVFACQCLPQLTAHQGQES